MIDKTIIYDAKKHHTKTNESTIKTAAPAGRCMHFTTMFQLMPCPASSTMTGDWSADAITASGAFCSFRHAASCIPAALTVRIPKNNALLVTIFLISGFIHITSEMFLVKVYVREQGNMTVLETEKNITQLLRNKKMQRQCRCTGRKRIWHRSISLC